MYVEVLRGLRGPHPQQPFRVFLHDMRERLETAIAQTLLDITLLAYNAWRMVQAIGLTLVRMVVTQRKLLEWETAAAAAARIGRGIDVRTFASGMVAAPAISIILLIVTFAVRRHVLSAALPFLSLWF